MGFSATDVTCATGVQLFTERGRWPSEVAWNLTKDVNTGCVFPMGKILTVSAWRARRPAEQPLKLFAQF